MPLRSKMPLEMAATAVLVLAVSASSAAAAVRIGTDPYTSATIGQHATAVEPDSFASGSTIVAAFQIGRTSDGGAANGGWATSTDSGATWAHKGVLPGVTKAAGGPHARLTDPAVAFDPKHGVWLIETGALDPPGVRGSAVVVNRSTDGGLTWSKPVTIAAAAGEDQDFDKNWIVCDDNPGSPHYGNCYAQWDDFGNQNRMLMSTSTDGGKTWGAAKTPAGGSSSGLGGQPLVQPNGNVIVPYASDNEGAILSYRSTNGGSSWTAQVLVATVAHNRVPGQLRTGPLPSAEIDGAGRVYVAWEDCRFRPGCSSNDIVIAKTDDGVSWSNPARVPIDPVSSDREHFVPGLGVARGSAGSHAHLGLAYHYMPTCKAGSYPIHLAFVDSLDGGATWSRPTELAGPMAPNWLASTSDGFMTGDYISTSFAQGSPHPVYAAAKAPSGGRLDEAIYAASPPLLGPSPQVTPHDCSGPPPPRRTLTNLKLKPSKFQADRNGPSIAAGGNATVSYADSAAGTTRFKVRHRERRQGSVCGPPKNGKPQTCQVWVTVDGSFKRQDAKGQNSFHFTGHIGGRKLAPGVYQLVAEPRASGKSAGKTVSAQFTIVKQPPSTFRSSARPARRTAR